MARYQARKLWGGDVEGLARACGAYVGDQCRRSASQTVIANARSDRRCGVRFARVPSGGETCTFCLMPASRGAVYWSREAAGEHGHYRRGCDCKIVPACDGIVPIKTYDCTNYEVGRRSIALSGASGIR